MLSFKVPFNSSSPELDRAVIEAMSKQGSSVNDIAEALGIQHRVTIYREFKRCGLTLKTYTAAGTIDQRNKREAENGSTYKN